ncbi:MAG: imidazole glycerol phosphate synthase subunit HisH [Thermanaerothrix sp.]|nr:imidazole glycerol phosphate synthase subunit HisH [Thermanaerothrix sp.]
MINIAIVSCSFGNINSIVNMMRYIGVDCNVSSSPNEIARAEKLLLPGVGAFDVGMKSLRDSGLLDALCYSVLERGVPILGICLGMQLMAKRSEEGSLPGLGWINAEVVRFRFPEGVSLKVPHMGWNSLSIKRENRLIKPEERQRFYFVHSYHVMCDDASDVVATCEYGYDFVAAFEHDNIFGVQFHPEKSHKYGMALIKRFVEM